VKLLLTGATGFVGAHVARRFAEEGYDLRIVVRRSSDLGGLAGVDYERVYGDVTDRPSIEAAMEGVDAVLHMAGLVSFLPGDRDRLLQINVGGTLNVLGAALERDLKVLYTSSFAAVGASKSERELLDERAVWDVADWANDYVISKRRAEEAAWGLAARGLKLKLVNPGIVWGPGDRHLSSTAIFLGFVKGEFPGYMKGGSAYVDVRDVAEAHLKIFRSGRERRRYIISAANISNDRLVELAVMEGGARRVLRTPYAVALTLAAFNERVVVPFRPERGDFNTRTVKTGARFWYADNTRSREELGLSYRPIEDTVRDTLRWALAHGQLEPSTPQLEALAGVEKKI
jgi:dihydroflavonol-4-reductase